MKTGVILLVGILLGLALATAAQPTHAQPGDGSGIVPFKVHAAHWSGATAEYECHPGLRLAFGVNVIMNLVDGVALYPCELVTKTMPDYSIHAERIQ